jgi:hypothetical protein
VGCLEEWSMHVNTCPLDRRVFVIIRIRSYPDRRLLRSILVTPLLRQILI